MLICPAVSGLWAATIHRTSSHLPPMVNFRRIQNTRYTTLRLILCDGALVFDPFATAKNCPLGIYIEVA